MTRKVSAQTLSNTLGGTTASWDELSKAVNGHIFFRETKDYYYNAAVNNLRYMALLPQAIAVVSSEQEAAAAIQWCKTTKMPFRIKGGGHSYAGFSTCPELVISTSGLNGLSLDQQTGTVTAGAGVINYDLYDRLAMANRTITHGRCPTVGVAGFVMGGGIGFDMRRFGMACDLLTKVRVVTADGEVVEAPGQKYSDLFWALRGGAGGNFGLATSFDFKTIDVAGAQIRAFQRQYVTSDLGQMSGFVKLVLDSCQAMSEDFGSRISVRYLKPAPGITGENQFQVDMVGQWTGEPKELDALFAKFDKVLKPNVLIDFTGQYWAGQHLMEDDDAGYFYQERSTFIETAPSPSAITAALEVLQQRPDVHGTCDLRFFQTGGAINKVAPDATAFVHRNSQWLAVIGYYWQGRDQSNTAMIEAGHLWQDSFYSLILSEFKGEGAFQNFPDISLLDWQTAYYGKNLDRLKTIKQKYDPGKLFDFQQAIPPQA
ncbi:FAD-binding oxidoreductase [Rhizobium paknamense]|uniref:FAD-binding PCMH-type domain-containing protein n=1 Tax=Rhizobium paknamense TaxID=1206817 RepID=A0ABU0IJC5_9HYPH|nr:FAD-binding oxidoreductase [Rhizobium paknamense]MDQ0457314.1 hypothetical protein [Rhizobium paknamense]